MCSISRSDLQYATIIYGLSKSVENSLADTLFFNYCFYSHYNLMKNSRRSILAKKENMFKFQQQHQQIARFYAKKCHFN